MQRGMRVTSTQTNAGQRGMRVTATQANAGQRGMRVTATGRPGGGAAAWRRGGLTNEEYRRARGFIASNTNPLAEYKEKMGIRGMKVTEANRQANQRGMKVTEANRPANQRGIGVVPKAPTFAPMAGSNFEPWMKRQMKSNETLLAQMPQRGKVNLKSKNNLSAFVNSARAKGGLELYKKFGGYYVMGHGFCMRNSGKFKVPKDKAILYVAKSGESLGEGGMGNLEKKLLRNNGRVASFIQGSGKVTGLAYAGHNTRLFLPGEEVYDQYIHLTTHGGPINFKRNSNANFNFNRPNSHGPSFGHIYKLPLSPGFDAKNPFNFNRQKNKILWKIPGMLSNRTVGLTNSERYNRRKETWKVSSILRNGPPGIYVIGTCRQNVFNLSNISSTAKAARDALRGMKVVPNNAGNYFRQVAQANARNPSKGLMRTRNNIGVRT